MNLCLPLAIELCFMKGIRRMWGVAEVAKYLSALPFYGGLLIETDF